MVNKCWGGEMGKVKSINVNVGPLSQPCNLPAEETPADIDWDLWLGPAPWAPYNGKRCSGSFLDVKGNSWRSYIDYSGGGMTDWGAHHFGGATFAVDVREFQPEAGRASRNDNGQQWLEYKYSLQARASAKTAWSTSPTTSRARGIIARRQRHGRRSVEGQAGAAATREAGGIYGDFIDCVKTREKPFRDIELAVNAVMLPHLATIAYKLDRSLKWDEAAQQFVNDEEADRFLDRARREPWQL